MLPVKTPLERVAARQLEPAPCSRRQIPRFCDGSDLSDDWNTECVVAGSRMAESPENATVASPGRHAWLPCAVAGAGLVVGGFIPAGHDGELVEFYRAAPLGADRVATFIKFVNCFTRGVGHVGSLG